MKLKSLVVMAMMLMSSVVVRAQMDFPDADSKYATELLKPGTKAPAFHLKTAEGKNFRLSSLLLLLCLLISLLLFLTVFLLCYFIQ